MGLAGNVAHMGQLRNAYALSAGKLTGRGRLDLGVDERIILKEILNTYRVKICTGFIWLRIGSSSRLL
jgi:hypothetical protein